MSGEAIKELARERLAAAELASVLGVPIADVIECEQTPRRARWLVAATLLLGLGVAVGAAWLRSGDGEDDAEVQQRGPIDVVDPWWHEQFNRYSNTSRIASSGAAARAGRVEAIDVRLTDARQSWLQPLLAKPEIRYLGLHWKFATAMTDADWRAIAAMPNLECLFLAPTPELRIEHLRELRHAPKLKAIWLEPVSSDSATFGKQVVTALAELPRLRMVSFFGCELTRDAVSALAGLQNLDTLMLDRVAFQGDLFPSLAVLTQLRSLVISHPSSRWYPLSEQLHELKALPRLVSLELAGMALDEFDLRQLPPQLEALRILDATNLTPDGISVLTGMAKLRSLAFRGSIPAELRAAIADVIEARELENFECYVQSPSPRMWRALQRSPRLAGLAFLTHSRKSMFAQQLAECTKMTHLRDLELKLAIRPDPGDLAVLRGLKDLRVVRLTRFSFDAPGWPSSAEQGAIEDALGPDIKLIINR